MPRLVLFADYRRGERSLSRLAVVYGPLVSRRRGLSLGINTYPGRTVCSFDCIYCFRGGSGAPEAYPVVGDADVTPEVLRRALEEALSSMEELPRAVDFSGNGEPTLHPRFPELVEEARRVVDEYSPAPSLGLFTNSTRLCSPSVASVLPLLDYIEAKLDSALEWKYVYMDRPHHVYTLGRVVECLSTLRSRTPARIAVQVMLLRYGGFTNCTPGDAEALADTLSAIEPDVVNLYTVYAPPRTRGVVSPGEECMERFASVLRSRGFRVAVYPR